MFARTFHPDEANQAFTTGHLLETGRYEYRPDDHHGPTLYYAAAALQKAAGFVRRELGRRVDLRYVPEILFELDTNIEYAAHINQLLKENHVDGEASDD